MYKIYIKVKVFHAFLVRKNIRGQLANASCYVIKQKDCASKKIIIDK